MALTYTRHKLNSQSCHRGKIVERVVRNEDNGVGGRGARGERKAQPLHSARVSLLAGIHLRIQEWVLVRVYLHFCNKQLLSEQSVSGVHGCLREGSLTSARVESHAVLWPVDVAVRCGQAVWQLICFFSLGICLLHRCPC